MDTQPCILILTFEHLYILATPTPDHTPNKPTPSSSSRLQVFSVQSCSITTTTTTTSPSSSSSPLIELCIKTTPLEARGGVEDPPKVGGDFDRVEWFVRQSNAELQQGDVSSGGSWEIGKVVAGELTKGGSGLASGGSPLIGGSPLVSSRGGLGGLRVKREEGEEEEGVACSPREECLVVRMDPCVGLQLLAVYQSLQYGSAHSGSIYVPLKLDTS